MIDAKTHLHDVLLAFVELAQCTCYLGVQALLDQGDVGHGRVGVHHHVEQAVLFAFDEGGIDADVATAGTQAVVDLLGQLVYQFGQFVGTGLAFVLLLKLGHGLAYLVHSAHLVERQAHDAALLCQCLQDGLTYPPYGVADELESTCLVEFLGSLDEAHVAFVDEVGQGKSLVLILLCYTDHKTQVGTHEFVQRLTVALADALRKLYFFVHREQGLTANLLQILVQRGTVAAGNTFGYF